MDGLTPGVAESVSAAFPHAASATSVNDATNLIVDTSLGLR
jgi:hypothetical protein